MTYESLYPNLITGGNYAKAYSVSSMLQPLAEAMTPLASLLYTRVGIAPLFLADAILFFVAACFETRIEASEEYRAGKVARRNLRYMLEELKEGLGYLRAEPGLLCITVYFFASAFCGTGARTLWLPYFKAVATLGVVTYTLVQSAMLIGRFLGGLAQYRIKYPAHRKYAIALAVYIAICFLEGSALFTHKYVMILLLFLAGLLAVTSYNIRISTTQRYVPDIWRGRFNGVFQMVMNLGNIGGTLAAGALGSFLPARGLVVGFMAANLIAVAAVAAIVVPGRTHIARIYNRDV